jgi:hypothetical protein
LRLTFRNQITNRSKIKFQFDSCFCFPFFGHARCDTKRERKTENERKKERRIENEKERGNVEIKT